MDKTLKKIKNAITTYCTTVGNFPSFLRRLDIYITEEQKSEIKKELVTILGCTQDYADKVAEGEICFGDEKHFLKTGEHFGIEEIKNT